MANYNQHAVLSDRLEVTIYFHRFLRLSLFGFLLVHISLPIHAQEPADLVLTGGKVITVDRENPQATALAARGELIVAVGTDQQIGEFIGSDTRVIDLKGRLVVPGFIDGHGHFMSLGDSLLQLDFRNVKNWQEVIEMVKVAVAKAKPGELIRGRGWHQEKWDRIPEGSYQGLPDHKALSAVSPENPVILYHASGHAAFANAYAMRLSKIDGNTVDPTGGEVVKDTEGNPIGIFRETASDLLAPAYERSVPADRNRVALLAAEECLSKGVTSFQDAGSSMATVEMLHDLTVTDSLGVRLWMMLSDSNEQLRAELPTWKLLGVKHGSFAVGGIKRIIDGALGSHGAWMLQPYSDKPEWTGLNTTPVDTIEETARIALEHQLQLCVHAIGDRANREILGVYERAFETVEDGKQRRWRVEHAQHLHPQDVPRFAELGIIASMQGIHCTSDGSWVPDRIGKERSASGAYLWRELIDSGVIVSNGTDCPVEEVDPIQCYHATVSRILPDGTEFYPERRMTRMEALRSYTLHAAHAAFQEDEKGSITVGKLCDVVVLNKDILSCPIAEIVETRVELTIVGGEVRYRRP